MNFYLRLILLSRVGSPAQDCLRQSYQGEGVQAEEGVQGGGGGQQGGRQQDRGLGPGQGWRRVEGGEIKEEGEGLGPEGAARSWFGGGRPQCEVVAVSIVVVADIIAEVVEVVAAEVLEVEVVVAVVLGH